MHNWATPTIAVLWTFFLVTHVGLSSQRLRPRLIARLGLPGFLGAYSALAFAIFIPLVWVYASNKHVGSFLWYGSQFAWIRTPIYLLMALAFTLVIGSFINPSPASLAPGSGELRGLLRITRHPLFMGVGLIGLLHLCLARIHSSDLAFFAGLPIVGLIGCWHQDQRNLARGDSAFHSFYDATSFLPFGRGGLRALVDPPIALLAGIAATIAIRIIHPSVFGGS